MNSYILVGMLIGLPLVLALLLRVSAVYLFASVAAGALLAQYFADDMSLVLSSFFTSANPDQYVALCLQIVPVLLTLFFMRKTLSGTQFIVQFVPLVVVSGAFAAQVLAGLPGGVRYDLTSNPIGNGLQSSQDVLVAASALSILLLMWLTLRTRSHSKKH